MAELLSLIEREKMAMPLIEQRWSARSRANMSPAHSNNNDQLFCWVGILMYMPTEDPAVKKSILDTFRDFKRHVHGYFHRTKTRPNWLNCLVRSAAHFAMVAYGFAQA
jgi:hypothetical protein